MAEMVEFRVQRLEAGLDQRQRAGIGGERGRGRCGRAGPARPPSGSGRGSRRTRSRQHPPDHRLALAAVLEVAAGRHDDGWPAPSARCAADRPGPGSPISTIGTGGGQPAQPERRPARPSAARSRRRRPARRPRRDGAADEVGGSMPVTATPLSAALRAIAAAAKRVDLGRVDVGGAGLRGGDGDEPAAGAEIEHARPAHQVRMVEQVARQRLAARPRRRPSRAAALGPRQPLLGRLPDRRDLGGEMQADLRHQRRRRERRVGADEGGRGDRVSRRAAPRRCRQAAASRASGWSGTWRGNRPDRRYRPPPPARRAAAPPAPSAEPDRPGRARPPPAAAPSSATVAA